MVNSRKNDKWAIYLIFINKRSYTTVWASSNLIIFCLKFAPLRRSRMKQRDRHCAVPGSDSRTLRQCSVLLHLRGRTQSSRSGLKSADINKSANAEVGLLRAQTRGVPSGRAVVNVKPDPTMGALRAWRSEFALINTFPTSRWPYQAAKCRGVYLTE